MDHYWLSLIGLYYFHNMVFCLQLLIMIYQYITLIVNLNLNLIHLLYLGLAFYLVLEKNYLDLMIVVVVIGFDIQDIDFVSTYFMP